MVSLRERLLNDEHMCATTITTDEFRLLPEHSPLGSPVSLQGGVLHMHAAAKLPLSINKLTQYLVRLLFTAGATTKPARHVVLDAED